MNIFSCLNLKDDTHHSDKDFLIGESLSEIYKDAFKYAPSKLIGMLMNLISVAIYTNLLLPKEYGLYMVAISVISFLAIIFSDWIGISALRFFKEFSNKHNIKSYFSTIFLLLTVNLCALYISGFFFFEPLKNFFKIPSEFLVLVFVLLIPIAIRALLFQILRAQIKPLTYTFSVIFNQISTIALAVIFIKYCHMGATAILAGMFLSIIFIDFVMIIFTKYYKAVQYESIHLNILSGLYKYGIPVAMSSIGMWLLTQSNRFVLQSLKGSEFNGLLGVGYNLTYSIMLPLFSILTLAAIPRLFNHYEDKIEIKPLITIIIGKYFLWFLPVTTFLCIYSQEVIKCFSNSHFSNAGILIPFLSFSAFFLGLTDLTTVQYYLVKKTTIDMWLRLISGFLGLILNIIFLPKFGLIAIGAAALISQLLYFILSLIIKIKEVNWVFPFRSVLKALIIVSITSFIALLFKSVLLSNNILMITVHIVFFICTYLLMNYAFNFVIRKLRKI